MFTIYIVTIFYDTELSMISDDQLVDLADHVDYKWIKLESINTKDIKVD